MARGCEPRRRGNRHAYKIWGIYVSLWVLTTAIITLATCADGATDPTDVTVLKEFLAGIEAGTGRLSSWTGDDPCGGNWQYVLCDGISVTELQLAGAKLVGTLPKSVNQLANLKVIALQGNNFTGALPSFAGLGLLQAAYLNGQSFLSIPQDFFQGLSSLTLLALDYSLLNKSSGGWALPPAVAQLTQLTTLSLTSTCLSGSLPEFLVSLPNLQHLHLAYNLLSGSIPSSFANLTGLLSLQLNNQLSPAKLTGSILPVASLSSITQLWLHVNAFSDIIPPSLGTLVSLQDCRLNDNQHVGPIPSSLASCASLTVFSVRHNKLDGAVPKIPSLSAENYTFDGNLFCSTEIGGSCAPEVNALLAFLGGVKYPTELAMSWGSNNPCNSWIGISCDEATGKVVTINLPDRNLSGTIVPEVANLTSLQNLILSNNQLTGIIPASLATLHSLKRLSLQSNNFYAPVPSFPSSVAVNLDGNRNINKAQAPPLPSTGGSPSSSNGSSTNEPANRGRAPVVTGFPSSSVQSQFSDKGREYKSHSTVGAIAGGVAGATAIACLATLVIFIFLHKKKSRQWRVQSPNSAWMHSAGGSRDLDVVKFTVGSRVADVSQAQSHRDSISANDVQVVESGNLVISIQVLRNVTDNFSEYNVLGRGGFGVVYKGELDDGTKIAVKRMEASVVSNKGLNEFRMEIAVLTKVRHRHLVALLGYCIDGTERLLVYEFMPMGPLSQHLFDYAKLGLPPLNLKTRLSIALDVARGMEYLHGLAQTSFIHRDLKPSNILLGDDYRAKVSDFGLVKLASDDKSPVETRLTGTFGYLAPEYAVTGRVSTKSDVFSFGVVLMELLTGRKALDDTQPDESVHLVTWFRRMSASKDDFRSAIDPVLGVEEETSLASVKAVAELARYCTMRDPWQRPDMSHAVNVLSPLVEQWKPSDIEGDEDLAIDLDLTLPQALKKWQAYEGATSCSFSRSLDTSGSMPSRPAGFAESFTSNDGR